MQSTNVDNEDLKLIDDIIFRFIWNAKPDKRTVHKIKKTIIQGSKANGGLNAPDIFTLNKAIKYRNVFNVVNDNHPIYKIYKKKLSDLGVNLTDYDSDNIRLSNNAFINTAIQAHNELTRQIKTDIDTFQAAEGIHKCYYSYVQNYKIPKLQLNMHQQGMVQRLLVNGIDTVGKLINERQNPRIPNLYLDVYQIYNSIPGSWKRLLVNTRRIHPPYKHQYIGTNRWSESGFTLKDIRTALLQGKNNININEYVVRKHPLLSRAHKNPFVCVQSSIKDVKLRNVQYKILHNIYPTMQHLYKWGIKQTQNCSTCEETETLEHAIFMCPVAKDAIKKLEDFMSSRLNSTVNLSFNDVLLGTMANRTGHTDLNVEQKAVIDIGLVLLKQALILQRENKMIIEYRQLCNIIVDYAKREVYNKKVYRKQNFNHYWYDILS